MFGSKVKCGASKMRTAVINSANVLQRLTRSGGKESFSFLKNYLSLSLRRKLHVAAAPYSTTSVYSTRGSYSATSTVIYCLTRRHSVAHPRTFQSLLLSRCMTTGNRSSPNTANTVRYIVATAIAVLGLSYAAVPLYRLFCQASGYGGTVTQVDPGEKVEKMEPDRERTLVVRWVSSSVLCVSARSCCCCCCCVCVSYRFNADTSAGMRWQFKPQQREITVRSIHHTHRAHSTQ